MFVATLTNNLGNQFWTTVKNLIFIFALHCMNPKLSWKVFSWDNKNKGSPSYN